MLVACLGFFTSCGEKGASEKSEATNNNTKQLGITVMTLANPFFVELADAAKAEAEKHGYNVVVLSGDDAEKQAKQMKDFISQNVDAIIVAPQKHPGDWGAHQSGQRGRHTSLHRRYRMFRPRC